MLYVFAFLGGLAGSLHCVGMCGAFPLALARARQQGNLARQVLYNAGRLNTLAFVGALSGGLGAALVASPSVQLAERLLARPALRSRLSLAAGVLVVAFGVLTVLRGVLPPGTHAHLH